VSAAEAIDCIRKQKETISGSLRMTAFERRHTTPRLCCDIRTSGPTEKQQRNPGHTQATKRPDLWRGKNDCRGNSTHAHADWRLKRATCITQLNNRSISFP
jgi:hypothetical protein